MKIASLAKDPLVLRGAAHILQCPFQMCSSIQGESKVSSFSILIGVKTKIFHGLKAYDRIGNSTSGLGFNFC